MALDCLLGDPHGIPHIVVGMGRAIAALERRLRSVFPKTPRGEFSAGAALALTLGAASFLLPLCLLGLCRSVSPALATAVEGVLAWQCLARRALRDESMAVYAALTAGDIASARRSVGWIVGRDTDALDAAGVARAAVETVAENTCDGVIAPMIFLAIGGAPLGMLYKAISTMDSMIAYRNARYEYFGKSAARLDDAANFIPARLAGVMMVLVAPLAGLDAGRAWRIFARDRSNHKSPNSAHTEAACAGALGIQLGGDAVYGGVPVKKPRIGDERRAIVPEDIRRANTLAAWTAALCFILCVAGRALWIWG
jgi:adenosylcobinamide-phosphate synthase